jgi:acyl-CoA thioesterase FadM
MEGGGDYRGTVYPWEVDIVEHLTVAYYFERFADATLGLLEAIGLGAPYMTRTRQGCLTVDCYVRYAQELRVGDILHIASGVIAADEAGVTLGHQLYNSDSGALCATVEQGTVHAALGSRRPVPLTAEQRRAAEARRVHWEGPPREAREEPAGLDGFTGPRHRHFLTSIFGQARPTTFTLSGRSRPWRPSA